MGLDLTAPGRHNGEPHWRRYLDRDGRIVTVCVQDFDYGDYVTSRFVDADCFASEADADAAPINVAPLMAAMGSSHDLDARNAARRNLRAILRQNGVLL